MAGEAPCGETQAPTSPPCRSPISILPPELLADIFEYCTVADVFNVPIRLSHVSTLWRHTAITTPKLWRSVYARLPSQSPRTTSARVRTWLARSGAFPLHISLVVTKWDDDSQIHTLPFLSHIRNHCRHWSHLSVIVASYDIARNVFAFFNEFPHRDLLYRLDLSTGLEDEILEGVPFLLEGDNEDARADITSIVRGLTHAPRFTELNLATPALPYPFWSSSSRMELSHLRTLRIFELNNGHIGEINALSVLYFLAKCPALEFLSFRGSNLFEPHSAPFDMVDLHYLRHLHLAQTFHQRIILSHLFTPALEELRLSWLNRPEVLIDESYEPDPTEVNEQPEEFSQSPYTDILTGAGVRSLIRRSAPPIRILDMDFADARSPKDFLWLFERLPTLESFRIIGSDMSDKVLDVLTSKWNNGEWLCPRLTSLEFSRCDVITGRGIVGLAKARNPPEEVEDSVSPARLTKFIVEACARVDCESVALKQYILDEVDFEVEVMPSARIYPEEGLRMPS